MADFDINENTIQQHLEASNHIAKKAQDTQTTQIGLPPLNHNLNRVLIQKPLHI
jgi:hypothetical protein